MMTYTYLISSSAVAKVQLEYNVAFKQAQPRRLNFYAYLAQEHGIVNIVVGGEDLPGWWYQATFRNERSATAFLLRGSE